MKRGLYIGRFQPFHLGHFNTLKEIEARDEVDQIIIAVGSSLTSYTPRNPFTVGERIEMIINAVKGKFGCEMLVFGISDIEYNNVWVSHIVAQLPKFDIVYTNNPLVAVLFKDAGFQVVGTSMTDRSQYSSTVIRNFILNDIPFWKMKVAPSTVDFILWNNLDRRIKEINKTDVFIPSANQ